MGVDTGAPEGALRPRNRSRRRNTKPIGVQWYVAAGLFAVLAAFGSRYGWHRDELYFVTAGRHPAWGYPDQPPVTPLLAAGWDIVTGDRLSLFRLLPAATAALVVPLAAATTRRLGGSRADQGTAAVLTALITSLVAMGHLFSTSTFTLLATVTVVFLAIRAVQDRTRSAWLLLGLAAGGALQVQLQPGLVLACGVLAILLCGPREALRSRWPWVAAVITLVIAAPYLVWQTAHGWPQLEVAADIAAGGSTSSTPRWLVIPLQTTMVGPILAPVLLAGIVGLYRKRDLRWLAVAYGLFLVVITVTGGKPYYATGFLPALLAAGVPVVRGWLTTRARRAFYLVLLAAHVAGTALVCLPLSPIGSPGFDLAQAVNPDTGETVGWPEFQQYAVGNLVTLEGLERAPVATPRSQPYRVPGSIIALTANYGEAGAIDQIRRDEPALKRFGVYSGHNAYGEWGPPPNDAQAVIVIGDFDSSELTAWFTTCSPPQRFHRSDGIDNDEQDVPFRLCVKPRRPWPDLWKHIRYNG